MLLGSAVLLAPLLAEGALRAARLEWPVFHRPDPDLGMVPIPGASGWFTTEGRGWVAMSADGFRDTIHARARPADRFRIAVLGDSYAEALQVSREDTFWSRLEERLRGCPALQDRRPEVMNFGVSGYSTGQEYLMLRDRVWAYAPDLVLVALLTGNDIADNSPGLTEAPIPFVRKIDGRLEVDRSRTRRLGAGGRAVLQLLAHSRLAQLLNHVRLTRKSCGPDLPCGRGRTEPGEAGLRNAVYSPPADTLWHDAWDLSGALLAAMRDSARAHAAGFRLVILSNSIQVHPDTAVRERFRRAIGSPSLTYPDTRLLAFADSAGIPALALAPGFAARAARDGIFLHGWPGPGLGTGHWNEAGHRLAADTIAPWLCAGLVDP